MIFDNDFIYSEFFKTNVCFSWSLPNVKILVNDADGDYFSFWEHLVEHELQRSNSEAYRFSYTNKTIRKFQRQKKEF